MVRIWQRLETIVLLTIATGMLLAVVTDMPSTLLAAALVLLVITALARINGDRKRYQLLVWEDAYAEWAALRRYGPTDLDGRHDLFADAREVFAIDVEAMHHRWWEANIATHVRDTRTWDAVVDWMRRTASA